MLSRSDERILDKLAASITAALYHVGDEIRMLRIAAFGPDMATITVTAHNKAPEEIEVPLHRTYTPGPNAAIEGEDYADVLRERSNPGENA